MAWASMTDLSTGDLVTESHMDVIRGNIEYLLNPNNDRILRDNSGNYTTTSGSFVDVDATNLAATITTFGGPVLVIVSAVVDHSAASAIVSMDVDVDGSRLGGAEGMIWQQWDGATREHNFSISVLVTGLSAASHTFKLQWKTSGATASLHADPTNNTPVQLSVIEI